MRGDPRLETVVTLLERYHEFVTPSSMNGVGGTGEHVPLMPDTYTASVREIERLLRRMRESRDALIRWKEPYNGREMKASPRRLWWHVNEWYVESVRVPRKALVKVTTGGGQVPCLDDAGWPRNSTRDEKILHNGDGSPALRLVLCLRRGGERVYAEEGARWIAREFSFEPAIPEAAMVLKKAA